VRHHAVQEMVKILLLESLFLLGSPFAYGHRGTQNGWKLLSYPPYSLNLAPSDYHLFRPLKRSPVITTKLTWQSRKLCRAGCEELEWNSTTEEPLRSCNTGRSA